MARMAPEALSIGGKFVPVQFTVSGEAEPLVPPNLILQLRTWVSWFLVDQIDFPDTQLHQYLRRNKKRDSANWLTVTCSRAGCGPARRRTALTSSSAVTGGNFIARYFVEG